jgi:methanogenic corrinoid protein MtbC1
MGKGKCVSFEIDNDQTSSDQLISTFKKMEIKKSIHNFPIFRSLKSPMEKISKSFSKIKINMPSERYAPYPVQLRTKKRNTPKLVQSMSSPCNKLIIFTEEGDATNINAATILTQEVVNSE